MTGLFKDLYRSVICANPSEKFFRYYRIYFYFLYVVYTMHAQRIHIKIYHMATTEQINIRVQTKLKQDAQETAKALGTDLSTVVNMYLTEFVRERRLSFSLRDENGFTQAQATALDNLVDRIDRGEEKMETFESGEAFLDYVRNMIKTSHGHVQKRSDTGTWKTRQRISTVKKDQ